MPVPPGVASFDGASPSPTPVSTSVPRGATPPAPASSSAHGMPSAVATSDGTENLRANPREFETGLASGRPLTSALTPTPAGVNHYADSTV